MIKKIIVIVCFILGIIAFYFSTKFSSPRATGQTDKLFAIMLLTGGTVMVFLGINILISKRTYGKRK